KNDNNKSNAKAVYICCIQKVGGLAIAQITSGCFIFNKAKLCCNHLASYKNFKTAYSNEEVAEILSRAVPEDIKRNKNHYDISVSSAASSVASSTSSLSKQNSITNYSARS
ncbi:30665_t:CDS:2, partial [Racocetra persica]